MALTINTADYLIESDASILDLPAFHAELRDWEDSDVGAIHPVTHKWKALDLGGGAFFYQMDMLAPWQIRFPVAGNYQINGNLNATVIPVAGVYVERKTSAAYVTTAIGGSGPSAEDIADAVAANPLFLMMAKILRNKMVTDPTTGTITVFDDDSTTPLLSAPIFKDAAGTVPYNGTGAERRERLT